MLARAAAALFVVVVVHVAPARAVPLSCGAVADRVIDVLARATDARTRGLVAQRPKLRAMLVHRCETDGWVDEIRDCYHDARFAAELSDCRDELDGEQQQRLDDSIRAVETRGDAGVAIVGTLVEFATPIDFDGVTARLHRGAKTALDKLARVLAARPDIARVIVDVRTNADPDVLAHERAAAIRDHLTAAGVDAARISAQVVLRAPLGVEIRVELARPPLTIPTDVAAPPADAMQTANGVSYKILSSRGGSRHPTADDTVRVHYTGWTTDGRQFDSSVVRGTPATFSLRSVIVGWTEGVPMLAVGDTARLWIPEELAYKGSTGRPQGMLVFDVELLAIVTPRSPRALARVRVPLAADLALYTPKLAGTNARLVATIATSVGTLHCELLAKRAPIAVASFVGLATGQQPWRDPRSGEIQRGKRFYDGLTFHRVIPDFMIQGGDPLGNGIGGPGYSFDDETAADDDMSPGALAMANAGPHTNGSQFFILEVANPDLVGRHTVFGRCAELEVVRAIARVPRDADDRPTAPVSIKRVSIERRP
jgi:peptidyl-prolyl cis-trans isomerase A (cyclophilin A)